MDKGTNVYVKSVCEGKVCSCQSCKICQQMQKGLSLQCFPDVNDICDRHRGKKSTTDKDSLCKTGSSKPQTECECNKCSCDLCKMNNPKKSPAIKKISSDKPSICIFDPNDICERHRGRKKPQEVNSKSSLKCSDVKKPPTFKISKSFPPAPLASKQGRKLPKLKQSCDCQECKCKKCTRIKEKPTSLHTLTDPEDICDRHRGTTKQKCNFQPICDCKECHCVKCQALRKQVSLCSITARSDDKRKKVDDCPMCVQIKEQERKSKLCRRPSCQICASLCKRDPKQEDKKPALPPCDCQQCMCKKCKAMKKKFPQKHSLRDKKQRIPGECRLCQNIREKEERTPSLFKILNAERNCNCEVVAHAIGSMSYDLSAIHPLKF